MAPLWSEGNRGAWNVLSACILQSAGLVQSLTQVTGMSLDWDRRLRVKGGTLITIQVSAPLSL